MDGIESLAAFRLGKGAHDDPRDGACLMEAVAWIEGEKHSDHPRCVSPVLAAYGRRINDACPDAERQKLLPMIPHLAGSVSPAHERERREVLVWAAVTILAPAMLDRAGLGDHAAKLRAVPYRDWRAAVVAARTVCSAVAAVAAANAAAVAAANAAAVAAVYATAPDAFCAVPAADASAFCAVAAADAVTWRMGRAVYWAALLAGPMGEPDVAMIDARVDAFRELAAA